MASVFEIFGEIAINADSAFKTIDSTTSKAKGLTKTFGKVGEAATKLGKTVLAGSAAVAAGVGALFKASIGGYADYEQLVGGVETLFGAGGLTLEEYAESVGKSVDKVQAKYESLMNAQSEVFANAQNAYKTAGLSANEYMETATSFSASLISSLKGDTEEAARITDLAITDMSDNANKMGTDMGLIQNAYQGFAKQNYTMLDNLKLGYGGTKKEMNRLLKDASKLSGKKYNIKNLDDIIEAIHVIQTEMGITGTTAQEASETISGSWATLGTAFENLVAGMSDKNADFDLLFANVISAAENVAKNIGKVLPAFKKNVGKLLTNVANYAGIKIKEAWENTVYPFIKDQFKMRFGVELPDWDTLKDTISTKWAEVKAAFDEGGLTQTFKVLLPDQAGVIDQITEWWNGDDSVYSKLKELFKLAIEFVEPSADTVVEKVKTWWDNSVKPSLTEAVKFTFFEIVLPSWSDMVTDVSTWWTNDVVPEIQKILTVGIDVKLPSIEEIVTKVTTWLEKLQNYYQGYDPSRKYTPEELEAFNQKNGYKYVWDEETNQPKKVLLEPSEESESNIQSDIDGYDLSGEANINASAVSEAMIQASLNNMNLTVEVTPVMSWTQKLAALFGFNGSHADGLDRVPFNGYRAILHEDEAVLTASEAAVWRGEKKASSSMYNRRNNRAEKESEPINVTLNFNGKTTSSPYEIAGEVKNALELMRWGL